MIPFIRRFAPAAVAAALVTATAAEAPANIAAPVRRDSVVGQPVALSPTKLVVASERLSFDCPDAPARPHCQLRAVYRISNPSGERERLTAAFYTYSATGVAVAVDGRPVPQRTAPDPSSVPRLAKALSGANVRSRVAFALDVGPGASREVVITGTIPLGTYRTSPGYAMPPNTARHLLSGRAERAKTYLLDYLMAPINTWASVGDVEISVRRPARWAFAGRLVDGAASADEGGWTEVREGDFVTAARQTSGPQKERLALVFTAPPPVLENGGPFVGLGGRTGHFGGFRARVGYEVAFRQMVLTSIAAESDFRHTMQIVPAVELATPAVLILPSVGLGVGVPIQIKPDARPGARIQASMQFYPVGLFAAVDIFPKPDPAVDPNVVRFSLMGQIGF